ncbi:hypothetical protein Nepgr_027048 [Nepenthes gracilis]|uniref:Uncharacterized protein n=1 Tax=Nepenthes gracilis TaxID=150966 RepID=A0AAD3T7Z7_NEPGR|nr:hypothetical protein Nepgr_027048 [Nepenthes gracilis]
MLEDERLNLSIIQWVTPVRAPQNMIELAFNYLCSTSIGIEVLVAFVLQGRYFGELPLKKLGCADEGKPPADKLPSQTGL